MGEWKDVGPGGRFGEVIVDTLFGSTDEKAGLIGDNRTVERRDAGEYREVFRGPGQTTGEAIANGQFKDKK